MRMRRKPWARPELDICPFHIKEPSSNKGKWSIYFENDNPIYLELGCGRGSFLAELSSQNKDINFIGIDIKSDMLGYAKRNIEKIYNEKNLDIDNVCIFSYNIECIQNIFDKSDEIDRIYINFCNPWTKQRHNKKRLTYTRQLEKYKEFLKQNGEIYFKTDSDELFEASLKYFIETGFKIGFKTYDLHNERDVNNILTEHEEMFSKDGIKIKALIAKKLRS